MRRKDREVTDPAAIRQILDSARVMYMGLSDLGEPYVVPLNYGYTLENGILTFYFHSAPAGRKMEILKENPAVFCTVAVEGGLKGEGGTACAYGYAFASVMGQGRATVLTDPGDKQAALDLLMRHQTGMGDFTYEAISKVAVVRVTMESYTAKCNPQ